MSSLALNLTQWTALSAIGTLVLALATMAVVIVTVRIARADRKRDDAKRQEDRDWDSARRKEDRERNDQLRREDREELERRYRAEQRDREDYEARQVTVERERSMPPHIAVSTPAAYPIMQVEAQVTHWSEAGLGIVPLALLGAEPTVQDGYIRCDFLAAIPPGAERPAFIVRFVDRHGNLYYAYRQQTRRFPQDTDWLTAAWQIDEWIRTGPKPDEPQP